MSGKYIKWFKFGFVRKIKGKRKFDAEQCIVTLLSFNAKWNQNQRKGKIKGIINSEKKNSQVKFLYKYNVVCT